MKKSWIVYLLCCSDGKIYTGVTNDLEKRLQAHNKGNASKFTRARLPVRNGYPGHMQITLNHIPSKKKIKKTVARKEFNGPGKSYSTTSKIISQDICGEIENIEYSWPRDAQR
ncbi:MAG: GIY-YIG nuclease family protein [Syntrophales bacterium]|jgi:predicted GIY-YIG superfamily endonuclease